MFIGEFNINLDDSHRLSVPNAFKKYLNEGLVIAKGFEKCLYLYNINDWMTLLEKLNTLSITKNVNREFKRGLTSGAFETEVDAKGRICVGQKLIDYACLKKECVVIGVGDHMEIWDKDIWDKYQDNHKDMLSELGEELDI